jgi:hypothetical protein
MTIETSKFLRIAIAKPYIQRGMGTVRSRCLEYIETLQIRHVKELPLDQAKDSYSQIVGGYDPLTLKKVFGTFKQSNKTPFTVFKQNPTTGISNVYRGDITRETKQSKGYLEKLGLVHYEKRGPIWIMVVENSIIVPEIVKSEGKSIDDLYISPIEPQLSKGKGSEGKPCGVPSLVVIDTERERKGPDIYKSVNSNHVMF